MRFPSIVVVLPGVLLAGCGGAGPTPVVPEATLLRHVAWAGSAVRVRSAEDDRGISAGKYLLGERPFPSGRQDDSTMLLTVPRDTPGGRYLVRRVAGRDTVPLGTLEVHGYLDTQFFALGVDQFALPAPRSAPLVVVGVGDGLLHLYDLGTGTVGQHTRVPGRTSLCWSGTEGIVLLRTQVGEPLRPWRLLPVPMPLAGEPVPHPVGAMTGCFWVGSNAILRTDGRRPTVLRRQATWASWRPVTTERTYDGITGAVLSPGADRATLLASTEPGKVPIYHARSAEVTARVPVLRTTRAAAFSDDGESLAIAGSAATGGVARRLLLLRARDGRLLRDTVLSTPIVGLRFDPWRPLLYVVVNRDGRAGLEVLDRNTFRPVASLAVPASLDGLIRPYAVIAFGDGTALVFDGSRVFRFALPADEGVYHP